MAASYYIQLRFRRVNDWIGTRPYICGWPNFDLVNYRDGRGIVYGHLLLKDAVADWRHVPMTEYGDFFTAPFRAHFTWPMDYAGRQGYQGAFLNFHTGPGPGGFGYGTFLIVPGTCEFRDVPATELGLQSNPDLDTMDKWIWGAHRYALARGYATGLITGHRANYGQGIVCGVFLFPPGTADYVEIPGTELGIESGLPVQQAPPTPPPAPPPPPPPPRNGTLIVGLEVVPLPYSGYQGYQTAMSTNPAAWSNRDAVITGVRSRYGEQFSLAHRDRTGRFSGSWLIPPETGFPPTAPTVTEFNGMFVEGNWSATVPTDANGIVIGNPAFEIDWSS